LGGALIGFFGPFPISSRSRSAYAAATVSIALVQMSPSRSPLRGISYARRWDGLMAVVRRPLFRGLAVGYSLYNVTWGILIVACRSRWPGISTAALAVGLRLLWAGRGWLADRALGAGQLRLYGREVRVMTASMVVTAFAVWPIAAFGLTGLALDSR